MCFFAAADKLFDLMSATSNKHLLPGQFYGNVVNKRSCGGLVLSELKHTTPKKLVEHSHQLANLTIRNTMKTSYRLLTSIILLVVASPLVPAQQKPEPKNEPAHKMVEFHMALLKHGPKWTAAENDETKRLHQQHVDYVMSLLDSGKAVLAGPFTDDSEIDGVFIFRASSAAEAKAWAEADPTVASGFRVAEMHPWWSEDIFGKPTKPMKLTQTFLAFLTRGEKWTPEKTPATEEIQKGHMANINRLAEMKKLIAAGPFGDNGLLRGIFVFRVGSLEEAKALTSTDPAVQAGRLAMDIHPWMVPEGVIP